MKIIYIAEDGTQFDDEWDCKFHEWKMKHIHLNDIRFYDEKGQLLTSSPFDDIHYNKVEVVVVPNEEALQDLHTLVEYTGFIDYKNIDKIGTWKHYSNNSYDTGFMIKED